MKVVLINTYAKTGGAAVACNRLGHALRKSGVEVSVLTADGAAAEDAIVEGYGDCRWRRMRYKWAFAWERLTIFLRNGFSRGRLFHVSTATSGVGIASHPLLQNADIIHLHWVNQGFVSVEELRRILLLGKPVVWTMHDMWPATGICHHARSCTGYQTACGRCPYLGSERQDDLSSRVFRLKRQAYATAPIHFVACSAWLRALTEKSALLKPGDSVTNIPNPIDTEFFVPAPERGEARRRLGLPQDKKLILFGAVNAADKRKGIDYFVETLRILHERYAALDEAVELVVFGRSDTLDLGLFPYKCHSLGYLSRGEDIRSMYQAVDVYVTPSLEENLPNTIMEAMSCGTPCVGFNVGGIPEMINATCGYVARYKDASDMAFGINYVLDAKRYAAMSQTARAKVETEYSEKAVSVRYAGLYNRLLRPVQKPPLFSVITVTYNAAKTLPATLRSVKEQTFKEYEYIVVDGASKDETLQEVRQSGIEHRLISERDRGIYDAMNKGLKVARGEYLIFLNAGDAFYAADTLQKTAEAIGDRRPDIVYGETAIVDENRQFLMMRRLKAPEQLDWRSFAHGMTVCHQAFIVRRRIAPLYDLQYKYSADVDWCIRCMKRAEEIFNTHLTLINYLREGASTYNRRASLVERFRIMCKHYGSAATMLRHVWFAVRFGVAKIRGKE